MYIDPLHPVGGLVNTLWSHIHFCEVDESKAAEGR